MIGIACSRWSRRIACLLPVLLAVGLSPAQGADQKQAVYCVRFSPDGKKLVSGGANRKVQVWDIEPAKEIASFEHGGWIQTVDFSPKGLLLATGSFDNTVKIWNAKTGQLLRTLDGQPRGSLLPLPKGPPVNSAPTSQPAVSQPRG